MRVPKLTQCRDTTGLHEMVSACAGLSCMTSHGVAYVCATPFPAERTSKRMLVCPKDAARFEDIASNNPAAKPVESTACHRIALTASVRWCVPPAEPAWRTSVCVMAGNPYGDCFLLNGITYRLIHCHCVFQCKTRRFSNTLVVRTQGKDTLTLDW